MHAKSLIHSISNCEENFYKFVAALDGLVYALVHNYISTNNCDVIPHKGPQLPLWGPSH